MKLDEQTFSSHKTAMLTLKEVTKVFKNRARTTVALHRVTFTVAPGRIVALVGESGSGKTTLARIVTGIEKPTEGSVTLGEWQVDRLRSSQLRVYRRYVQMVFQDPFSSLNPHNTVLQTIVRPLMNHLHLNVKQARLQALEIMNTVRLTPTDQFAHKKPHQLSGGQRQRLVIARAIAPNPELIVADEPVSMLDVSIRADILELIDQLRKRTGMSVLYITHDLYSARAMADEVVVLYKGHVVERGNIEEVISHAQHPYTQLLLQAIPNPWKKRQPTAHRVDGSESAPHFAEIPAKDEITLYGRLHAGDKGCPFAARCELVSGECLQAKPSLKGTEVHQVSCWNRQV
ncbi:ABC transporter ATP-binding protein [Sulfoacidibacillus thermotolerans]|uniref:ABC transporter domain-containing protein n=1 Tax=Sulfoacidibacillus thermotolerans TaxID=1765684 RepID=A0A2U3DA58_SULT2|nr:oligopeptide/dipeptide ABC transporter ATP-binding protein [Sulfoacidibacillus thermotolerans]PWI58155.1 hypothetical protein BM613_04245 [Sulfoacidibacillus thermotolerans]